MTPPIKEALSLSRRVTIGPLNSKVTLNTEYHLICVPFQESVMA